MSRLRTRLTRRERNDQPVGTGGKLIGSLFFGVFLAMGLAFTYFLGQEVLEGAGTYRWEERRCEILESEVTRQGGEDPYRLRLRFRSADAGRPVAGNRLRRNETRFDEYGDAAARGAAYPAGAVVTCYASPDGEVVLERSPLWMALFLLLPLVFVAIGGIGIIALWKPEPVDAQGRPLLEDLGRQARGPATGRGVKWTGAVFVLVGGLALWFFAARPALAVWAARSWEAQRCTVEHSEVLSHRSDDGTTYSVDILYRWDRGRGVERSSRYSFFGGSSSGIEGKREVVRAHPVGAEVECWVDPERLNEAVLHRGLTAHAWIAIVPAVFLCMGVGLFVHGRNKQRRYAALPPGAGLHDPGDPLHRVLPVHRTGAGSTPLAAASSRSMRLAGIIAATLFWNGILSVFLYQVWQGFERGDPEWFLVAFLVPFVLVGVGLFFGIGYGILVLWNPKPELIVSETAPRLGQEIEIQWSFRGRADRLRRVRIVFRGEERATYTVGTNTHTATEVFFEQVLAELPAPACAMGGHVRARIPEHAMHSFEAEHNVIAWSLVIEGEIPRWPDVDESYPIVVLPGIVEAGR